MWAGWSTREGADFELGGWELGIIWHIKSGQNISVAVSLTLWKCSSIFEINSFIESPGRLTALAHK